MKKGTKLGLGAIAFFAGAMILTGCTNSFCSKDDRGHIMYAFDFGVSEYHAATERDALIEKGLTPIDIDGNSNIIYVASFDNCRFIKETREGAVKNNLSVPSLEYYIEFDKKVLNRVFEEYKASETGAKAFADLVLTDLVGEHDTNGTIKTAGILDKYGNIKFYEYHKDDAVKSVMWNPWNEINHEIRMESDTNGVGIDNCPTSDFVKYYQSNLESRSNGYRSCLAISNGYYGHYGPDKEHMTQVQVSGKDWGYAWGVGPLSGLLVYPIGWAIDGLTSSMIGGLGSGWAQIMAIFIVTLVVRGLMLAATFKQTSASTRMQTLQPEIAKIQSKYPNANTNRYEKQRMAEEMSRLYKKNKINPLSSLLVMFVQFPIFICVWGAMQGSAWLSTGTFLGLHLSDSISSVLTNWSNWGDPSSGVWTALTLFLLMSIAQVVAMLLPQWIQKSKQKKVQKLGRNPAQKAQSNKMKWFTYIMMVFIIIMGFSLASAMGVYWFIGALISIGQTLITNAVAERRRNKKYVRG